MRNAYACPPLPAVSRYEMRRETLLLQKVCDLEVVHAIPCCGVPHHFQIVRIRTAVIEFQPREPNFRDAGRTCVAQELMNLLKSLAAT